MEVIEMEMQIKNILEKKVEKLTGILEQIERTLSSDNKQAALDIVRKYLKDNEKKEIN
jgi:DNA-directed RNA polymerase subunit F